MPHYEPEADVGPKSLKELEADVLVLEQHNDALEDQLTILQRRLKELEGDLEASKLVNAQLRDALLRAVSPEVTR